MSELSPKISLEQAEQTSESQEVLFSAVEAQRLAFDALQQNVPEIHDNRPGIDEASDQIIGHYNIDPSFFEDEGRSLVFASIASRLAVANTDPSEDSFEEMKFLESATILLLHEYSPALNDVSGHIRAESSPISETVQLQVYDKYTDKLLTEAMKQQISQGKLLSEVKNRLGVTAENEDPYEIRVLSVVSDERSSYGLDPERIPALYEYAGTDQEKLTEHEKTIALNNAVIDQRKGLVQRGLNMAHELGRDELFAPAWVTTLNGQKQLCISMPLAEKLLNPELTKSSRYYGEDDRARDYAIFEHEYSHTQGGLNIDDEVIFGINLEELRAEHFSGNKLGYQDVKGFFVDYLTITGDSITDTFNDITKGGAKTDIYASIANRVGLSGMLEIVMSSPKNYIEGQSSQQAKDVHEYLGGYDSVLHRLLEAEINGGREDELQERISNRAKKLAEIIKPDIDFLWTYRKHHGLNIVTDMVVKRAEELGLKSVDETDSNTVAA